MTQQTAGALWGAITASGNTDPFPLQSDGTVFLSSIVTSMIGTTPSLTVFLDVMNVAGAWKQVGALTAQTGTGTQYAAVTPSAVAADLARTARLRWTVSGTGVSASTAVAVISA